MGGVWGFGGSGGGFEGFLGVVADFEVLLRQERGFNRGCHQKVMVFNRFAPSNMFLVLGSRNETTNRPYKTALIGGQIYS